MTDNITIVQEKIKGMQQMLANSPVSNDTELAAVAEKIGNVKKLGKYIEQEMAKLLDPAKAIIAEAKAKYNPYITECDNAEYELKNRARIYMDEQARIAAAKTEKIAARVEAGTLKPETAIKKMEQVATPQKTVKSEGGTGITRSVKNVAVIVNPELVPDEYWVIDEPKVKKCALAGLAIPGVEIKQESVISSR